MQESFTIAVIPQGSTHRYWKLMHAGAQKAAREFQNTGISVDVLWKAPIREGDHEEHKQIVESFLRKGVPGIVLAPFDNHFLVSTVEEAARKNVPTVVMDSELDTQRIVSYVGTDNRKAEPWPRIAWESCCTGEASCLCNDTERAQPARKRAKRDHRADSREILRRGGGNFDRVRGWNAGFSQAGGGIVSDEEGRHGARDTYAERIVDDGHAAGAAGDFTGQPGDVRGI